MSEESSKTVELRDYLDILWRRKWIVVLGLLALVGLAEFRAAGQDKVYKASGQIVLKLTESDLSSIETEIRILEGEGVRQRVLVELPSAGPVSGNREGTSRIVSLAVEGRNPELVARAVDAYYRAYVDYRREQLTEQLLRSTEQTRKKVEELKAEVATLTTEVEEKSAEIDALPSTSAEADRLRRELDVGVKAQRDSLLRDQLLLESRLRDLNSQSGLDTPAADIVQRAAIPTKPIRPTPVSDGITAAGAGLILGIILALLVEYLDDSIKTRDDIQRAIGEKVPVVAIIPTVSDWRDKTKSEVVTLTAPRSPAAEAFRALRTCVQFAGLERPANVLAISSPNAGEGKTTALANLAVVVASAGRRVVLLDCDLRRPRIHTFFGVSNDVGFTSWIIGDAPLSVALQDVPGVRRLQIMASGPIPPNPSELLSSRRFPELLKALQADGALVLIDTPPLLPVTDAAAIARSIDCMFMVTMAGRGTRKHLRQAMEILARVDAPVTGVVLNSVGSDRTTYSGGYYGAAEGDDVRPPPPSGPASPSSNGRKGVRWRTGTRQP